MSRPLASLHSAPAPGATQPAPPSASPRARPSFLRELAVYVGRVREFEREDWLVYTAWVGMMSGLVVATGGLVLFALVRGIALPAEALLVPLGALVFTLAIAVDTIGHRTIYRLEIARAEGLVHHVTIFCGISSCVLLCVGWRHRELFWVPAMVTTVLSFVYSLVDEAFHWRRYVSANSDGVEMSVGARSSSSSATA